MKLFILLLSLILLNACHSYHMATITVLESTTREPIEDASVTAYPMYLFNPTSENVLFTKPSAILQPFTAKGDSKKTNSDGQAIISIIKGNPLELTIATKNQLKWNGIIEMMHNDVLLIKPIRPNPNLIISSY